VSASVFIVSQGLILHKVRAVTAWNVPFIPVLFVTSGFAMGSGLMLLLYTVGDLPYSNSLLSIALICVATDLIVWFLYVHRSDDAAFLRVTKMLRHPLVFIFIAGIGHVLPILLLLAGIFVKGGLQDVFASLAGLFILTAGVIQKVSVVMGANYLRGISMRYSQDSSTNADQPDQKQSYLKHPYNRRNSISADFVRKKW
jgi:phenylacetyl-CoA:acceptor oxidoreductase subunit 2